ncbi:MAG: phosphoesterase [Gammaproteobacteria bacterium]
MIRKHAIVALGLALPCLATAAAADQGKQWLAGDHHVHSRFSVGLNMDKYPPEPIFGGDGLYPIPMNALMARRFGLDWIAATDHGGPNHSKISLERTYPELVLSRELVPDVIQFLALELNSPGADHRSLIIPHGHGEAERLYDLEHRFDKREIWPPDSSRDNPERMLEMLREQQAEERKPLVIAHHPSRSANEPPDYGLYTPGEFRDWNDAAPDVAVGMEGAPGRQAIGLYPDGTPGRDQPRGRYRRHPTHGGFDYMTARLGGLWDTRLGEGRRWWITANSDSHIHYTEGGNDFWPGEFTKTYVWAERDPDAIMEAIRAGRIFVTTGDLVSELFLTVRAGERSASMGGELVIEPGATVEVEIRFLDPEGTNHGGRNPSVNRVDLIVGQVLGRAEDREADLNPTTRVERRAGPGDWTRDGDYAVIRHRLENVDAPLYVRVRGTSTEELEPEPDPHGEDPWADLWFYSNPIFIRPG